MLAYAWPVALIVVSNTLYQICAKSVPGAMNPFAAFSVTYIVSAITSLVLYFTLSDNVDLLRDYSHTNWAVVLLGVVVVGLEVGFIYAYKAGWAVSLLSIVQSAILALVLIFVGMLLYQEAITWNKLVGIAICLIGLGFINR